MDASRVPASTSPRGDVSLDRCFGSTGIFGLRWGVPDDVTAAPPVMDTALSDAVDDLRSGRDIEKSDI